MEPYYQENNATIYLGDSHEILPEIMHTFPSNVVVVTDPPYVLNMESSYLKRGDTLEWWADMMNTGRTFSHLMKIIRKVVENSGHVWWFTSFQGIPSVLRGADLSRMFPLDLVTWWKAGGPRGYGVGKESEYVILMGPRRKPIPGGGMMRGVVKCSRSNQTPHPAEKPVELLRQLMNVGDAPGLILDPFMGSGSTLVAAQELGIPSVGIDCTEKWAEVAKARIAQGALFG